MIMETICVWWKTLCGMEHVKYVQYDIGDQGSQIEIAKIQFGK
jgi:hypothetical protein